MKQRLFNRGQGWYIPVKNYKDDNDKAYCNVHFVRGTEPKAIIGGQGYAVEDIDIIEWTLNCYKGKIGLTVFRYEPINKQSQNQYDTGVIQHKTDDMRELPFY